MGVARLAKMVASVTKNYYIKFVTIISNIVSISGSLQKNCPYAILSDVISLECTPTTSTELGPFPNDTLNMHLQFCRVHMSVKSTRPAADFYLTVKVTVKVQRIEQQQQQK